MENNFASNVMAWSVESLPANPSARVCVLCVLSCVVSLGGPDIVLTTHLGRLALV